MSINVAQRELAGGQNLKVVEAESEKMAGLANDIQGLSGDCSRDREIIPLLEAPVSLEG